jgi:GNAT superfamily N-acetyltransferase
VTLRKRRRPFVDLSPADLGAAGPDPAALFLGRLSESDLRQELEQAGILSGLASRGYHDVVIATDTPGGEHRLRVLPRRGRVSLLDLRLADANLVAAEPFLRRRGLDVLSFLVVRWVSLQDPLGRFAPDKPRLPGQRYPGLGLGRVVFERLLAWATAWGKDGLLNLPEYFHNAVFYSAMFRFLAPARQGRFEALRRDLAGLHVAEASAAVEAGRVREQPGNRSLRWEPGEMAAPIAAGLRDYLDSEEYAKAVAAASAAVGYRLA